MIVRSSALDFLNSLRVYAFLGDIYGRGDIYSERLLEQRDLHRQSGRHSWVFFFFFADVNNFCYGGWAKMTNLPWLVCYDVLLATCLLFTMEEPKTDTGTRQRQKNALVFGESLWRSLHKQQFQILLSSIQLWLLEYIGLISRTRAAKIPLGSIANEGWLVDFNQCLVLLLDRLFRQNVKHRKRLALMTKWCRVSYSQT